MHPKEKGGAGPFGPSPPDQLSLVPPERHECYANTTENSATHPLSQSTDSHP
jgi:hypothetical protein